jgi:pimeloyl-ACP methyl ester carboxylesterase
MNRSDSALVRPPRDLPLAASILGREDAPALLALHGITGSRRYWQPRILSLTDRYRLLIPDLPGFGQSPKPFADYTMDFFIEVLEGFLERQGETRRPLCVLGHSLGALIALELAARRPERIERLVLLNVPRFSDPESAHRLLLDGSSSYRSMLTVNSLAASWAQLRRNGFRLAARSRRRRPGPGGVDGREVSVRAVRLPWPVVVDGRKFSFRSISSTLEHCVLHYTMNPVLDALPATLPALLIHGTHDQVAPLSGVRELCERPPYPALRVIQGAGHNLYHTHATECLAMIVGFLSGEVVPEPRRA